MVFELSDRFKRLSGHVRSGAFPACRSIAFLWAALLCIAMPAGAEEYRLSEGDEIEVSVFRVPELDQTAVLDVDGRVAVPPLGPVEAAGATVDELAARIRDGLIEDLSLGDVQVTVALVAASPIFVGGDVASPGAYPSVGHLTVRRAVALAGGVGILRGTQAEEVPRLRGELRTALLGLERDRATLARISAEIAGRETLANAPAPGGAPGRDAPAQDGVPVMQLEALQLVANIAEARAAKTHLARRVALAVSRLERLHDQLEIQVAMMSRQLEQVQRIDETVNRGLGLQSRANDERRSYDGMQERLSDTDARIAEAEAALADARYEVERFDDRRRALLRADLQTTGLEVRTAQARVDALGEQLAQLGVSDRQGLDITVYRIVDGVEEAVPATEDTPLKPGDMVEVVVERPTLPPVGAPALGDPVAASR